MKEELTLEELSDASGIPPRTIRFYISRGLLDGPIKAGRGAVYTAGHLARLERIKALQAEGHMLAAIAPLLEGVKPVTRGHPPAAWWQHVIDDDVQVWTRADVSPWRMKQIRTAIDEMAGRLAKSGRKRSNK